jgi:FG-GAP-like repeat
MRLRLLFSGAPLLAALFLFPTLSLGAEKGSNPSAVPGTAIGWKKTVIDKKFRSEGVAIADVNKDGKMDILLGEVWFEAPDWKMHEIRKPARDYGNGQHGYSESFCCWSDDFNGDGWADLLVIRFPGKVFHWYENPQNKPGHWKEHIVADNACNETPQFVDLFGKGKRVLVMGLQPRSKGDGNQGQMVWLSPGKDPTRPWEVHPISEPSKPGKPTPGTFKFSHGLGVGDLNGDGRLDVICTDGWWEQPAEVSDTPWKFRPAKLGPACADMIVYDMDGDGKNDVITSSAHKFGIWWHKQRGGDKGSTPVFFPNDLFRELLSETHALHCVDINGDGLKDLITGKRWWSHGRNEPGSDWPAMLYWFEASRDKKGMVKFTPRVIDTDSGIGTQFVVADFNGDGLFDVVTSNKKGTYLFLQVRDGGVSRPVGR